MRGKVYHLLRGGNANGITPAHAGKRLSSIYSNLKGKDHPRACGEKVCDLAHHALELGSPPRMRGKGKPRAQKQKHNRITPAHAGKSKPRLIFQFLHEDHPRACGEKHLLGIAQGVQVGSPPHMRGKASGTFAARCSARITPAYAGKRSPMKPSAP